MSGDGWGCPLPAGRYARVTMAHGGGGTLMGRLVREELAPLLPPAEAGALGDAAWVAAGGAGEVALTTDSFVVRPLFFPGGDIGTLAVNGTLNDLAVSGARPVGLSVGMILEEGLETETLRRVAERMRAAVDAAGVPILTGDTKVVERGGGGGEPGLYVNTAGVGVPVAADRAKRPRPERIGIGDAVLVTGSVGRHGVAVMAERHGLRVGEGLTSDCASLAEPLLALWAGGIDVHCARDATRSGLGGVLCELAEAAGVSMVCEEEAVPVWDSVRAACEVLGFDPLFVANEGCAAVVVADADADRALAVLRRYGPCAEAARIGTVAAGGGVSMRTALGTDRRLSPPLGEQLPRIC